MGRSRRKAAYGIMAGLGLLVLIAGGIQRITAHGRAFPQGSSWSGSMAETPMGQRAAAEIAISHYLMGLGVLLVVAGSYGAIQQMGGEG